jgi:hypothetical protein
MLKVSYYFIEKVNKDFWKAPRFKKSKLVKIPYYDTINNSNGMFYCAKFEKEGVRIFEIWKYKIWDKKDNVITLSDNRKNNEVIIIVAEFLDEALKELIQDELNNLM